MASVDWYGAGRAVGGDLAETGGTAANIDVDDIGFGQAKAWLDGVIDGLREAGFDAKSIAVSPRLLDSMRETAGWQSDETYRGILLMLTDDGGSRHSIVVAV